MRAACPQIVAVPRAGGSLTSLQPGAGGLARCFAGWLLIWAEIE